MFEPEDIQKRLRQNPFRPLRIIATEGHHYDVHDPAFVMVGVREIMIGYPSKHRPTVYKQLVTVVLAHILSLEDIPIEELPKSISS